jgi:hypothetical protein
MLVETNEGDAQMVSRKLTKPAAIAAAAAIAIGGGTYTAAGVLLAPAAGAAQIREAVDRSASAGEQARLRPSPAAIGLAHDFGISRAAARELLESTYR